MGIDLLPVDPIDGVTILQMDFMHDSAPERLIAALGGEADLVLSDMAANTVGHPQTDHLRTMALVETGSAFAFDVLRPGGAFVAKVLAGGADSALVSALKRNFTTREARQAAGEPQGIVGMVCGGAGVQGAIRAGRGLTVAPAEAGTGPLDEEMAAPNAATPAFGVTTK